MESIEIGAARAAGRKREAFSAEATRHSFRKGCLFINFFKRLY